MKIGILGTGHILDKTASALINTECAELYAIASRNLEKAEQRKLEYGFEKAYGSYMELIEDPLVDLVYIITPHSRHFDDIMACLKHGKAVLCEKPITINAEQAKKVKEYANSRKLFAAEAIWTKYMPSRYIIKDAIESGSIGRVNALSANLHYAMTDKQRLTDPALAGGALLDVGIYCLNFAVMCFGNKISKIESSVQMLDSGVDGQESITLFFEDGRAAYLSSGLFNRSDRKGIIYGEKGYIIVENINNPQSVAIYDDKDELIRFVAVPEQISGYEYEFEEAAKALSEKATESVSAPLNESIEILEIMDSIRKTWGLVYPQERLQKRF